ncbi:Metal-dependent phosphoesterase (PHP family) [Halalkaliarchaeum sp. AArc-CO]|uniref:PHP domain-containing protein n=1 Tax=unclassified Halalkaliarchaeum TaxID=2678344 RepID=UPI00217F2238|nr:MULTISPECIES: PHP domain-containing protein [unclassified Halalkaliarchaeum]MDR5674612.1 PHP domain-containing protein [Halalkaliarchaeum sp. AArc-GB]UWG52174.1 Metal-dependent phosphoesterase (PHP family) [Halalkaliarchaeum sp. AArc-CO]
MGTQGSRTVDSGLVADLHVHTTVSDGELELGAVPAAARDAGLSWVGITDHDRLHPELSSPIVRREGVRIVRGIELRVEGEPDRLAENAAGTARSKEPFRVDLLGYAIEPTAELRSELDRIQEDRIERAREIVRLVESKLGVELDVPIERGVGRPHVARAIAESDAPLDYEGAFDELIGDGGPCFVARNVPSFERGVELLREAGRLVGLAHPLRYGDPEAALELAGGLDAVEVYYPYGDGVDPDREGAAAVEDARCRHDLLATGGSDAHGTELGTAGLDTAAFAPVREQLLKDN